jgi:hypothetical protein
MRAAIVASFCRCRASPEADRDVAPGLRMGGRWCWRAIRVRFAMSPNCPPETSVSLCSTVGTNMHPPHMEAFGKLSALRELHLPGPMWNPRAESRTEYSEELGHLAGLTTTGLGTFLETIRFHDVGSTRSALGPTPRNWCAPRADEGASCATCKPAGARHHPE